MLLKVNSEICILLIDGILANLREAEPSEDCTQAAETTRDLFLVDLFVKNIVQKFSESTVQGVELTQKGNWLPLITLAGMS